MVGSSVDMEWTSVWRLFRGINLVQNKESRLGPCWEDHHGLSAHPLLYTFHSTQFPPNK